MAGFRYLDLLVGPGALVPRPETELVAGEAIAFARAVEGHAPVVVDLGTGTGAIALAVASEVPGLGGPRGRARPGGPGVGCPQRRGAAATSYTCTVRLAADALPELDGTVDVVVSNPPYLPDGTWIGDEVRHDPALALWGGPDGLDVIREVVGCGCTAAASGRSARRRARRASRRSRTLVACWVGRLDRRATHRDLTGRDRFVTARRTR